MGVANLNQLKGKDETACKSAGCKTLGLTENSWSHSTMTKFQKIGNYMKTHLTHFPIYAVFEMES